MTLLRVVVVLASLSLLSACAKANAASDSLKICDDTYLSISKALAASFDYAEVRSTDSVSALESAGEKCKTAKNKEACAVAVQKTFSSTGWNNNSNGRRPGYHYAVVTRGDEVLVITPDKLLSALGAIDTPVKAGLVVGIQRGVFPKCEGAVRAVKGKYEVHIVNDSCFGSVDDVLLIDQKGIIEVVRSSHGPQRCVGALQSTALPTL